MKGIKAMKKYIKPEMEIDRFDTEDIITTSGGEGAQQGSGGEEVDW
ncbi:hypothetical protein [Ruminococcus flavefaciens]|nr:hypothetical protein [Ruminococcus flavefaciens]